MHVKNIALYIKKLLQINVLKIPKKDYDERLNDTLLFPSFPIH